MSTGQKATHDAESEKPEGKKLDLSAAQVAGSSLATVAAALLASKMGVYGTILGAGVVSVVATAGGPVIQHFFRRTGDQLRESARPKARQVPSEAPVPPAEEFGEATVHGTRVRGWRRTAVAAGAVFALSLGALGTYEAVAGTSVSSGGGTIFSGGTRTVHQDRPAPSEERPGRETGADTGTGTGEKGGKSPGPGTSPDPSGSPAGGGSGPSPDPGTSHPGDPTPTPAPSTPAPTPPPSTAPPSPGAGTPGTGGSGTGSSGTGGGQEQPNTP
ncbi:hypothetical protein [Streptomyces sp. NBC_01408]|uniref:hypothetical protein n=1 Tax=Streptomyces sp. NBC_01408 TaxID=2903855 RepID=UPI002254CCC9|nr:hypothetical protein [Streptomyces sp. NBC_01408]MCX4696545.1 hypothetical protein [Streptomyces sp. NBC_01408]